MTHLLKVSLNNTFIGTLTLLPGGRTFFAFDETYQDLPNKPVLSQAFFHSSGELLTEEKIRAIRLPPFFSNLLPEGYMREYLAQRAGIKSTQEFQLIDILGQDLPGAVIITPMDGVSDNFIHRHEPKIKEDDTLYHFSLAGVQLKFSAITKHRGGLTIPAHGVGGNWIVKLPAQNYAHVPENEYAIMHLASLIGIPVPEIKLVSLGDIDGLPDMGALAGKQGLS